MECTQREVVTTTKAIGIILMVLAHAVFVTCYTTRFINLFHMPLFFLMSGYCFKERYLDDAWGFIKRKLSGIYVPFIKWSLVFLLLHNLFYDLHLYGALGGQTLYALTDIWTHFKQLVVSMYGYEQLLGGFWFFRDLLFGNLLFYAVLRMFKRNVIPPPFVLLITTTIFRYTSCCIPIIMLHAESFYAATFISIGYAISKVELPLEKWWMWLINIAILTFGMVFNQHFGFTEQGRFSQFPYLIYACAGTGLMMQVAQQITKLDWLKKIMIYIGKNTLIILALHMLSFKLVSLFIIGLCGLPVEHMEEFPVMVEYSLKGWWCLYFVIGITIPIACSLLYYSFFGRISAN